MNGTPRPPAHWPATGTPAPSIGVLAWRAVRLRCPACGQAPIFRGWFDMHERCPTCGRRFNRAPGYLLGSIYFNYGVTGALVLALYFAMFFGDVLTDAQRLLALSAFAAVFAMWFLRYARAFWMAFDERLDPWPNDEERRQMPAQNEEP